MTIYDGINNYLFISWPAKQVNPANNCNSFEILAFRASYFIFFGHELKIGKMWHALQKRASGDIMLNITYEQNIKDEYDNMSEEERKKKTKSLEDFLKELEEDEPDKLCS